MKIRNIILNICFCAYVKRTGHIVKRIDRKEYVSWLLRWKEQQIIKVVSGVRRCGKSTTLDIFRGHLLENGIDEKQIITLNFEDVENEDLLSYKPLYEFINDRLVPGKMNYIFLDEIQHVDKYERTVDSLFLKDNCDVYITGSNANFLSGELATLLSGRYVELRMLPISFSEFCEIRSEEGKTDNRELFNQYIEKGSFPYISAYDLETRAVNEYLRDIYNTVLLKDIVKRLKVADVTSLENVTKFLFHSIGNRISSTKISNTLKSAGKSVDQKTVEKYLKGLTDSFLLYEIKRYNIKGRQHLTTQSKYYAVDIALRNTLVRGQESDIGHIIENIVYLELLRRGYDVFAGQGEGDSEVDFVAKKENETIYIQVTATALDEAVLTRELNPLRKIRDNYAKYLLTLDDVFGEAVFDGILKKNLVTWLLER